jgi:hypothetical protein
VQIPNKSGGTEEDRGKYGLLAPHAGWTLLRDCEYVVAILELDVLVDREFGLSHKNLLVLNTEKLTSWRFLRKRI